MLLNLISKQKKLVTSAYTNTNLALNSLNNQTVKTINNSIRSKTNYFLQSNKKNSSKFNLFQTREYSSYRVTSSILNKNCSSLLGNKIKLNSSLKQNSRSISLTMSNYKIVKVFDKIEQSSQDDRQYRGFILNNGLKCLVISDPHTDRSAASLDVNTGYMLDPKEFPGLAHFCEHMLFMGSKKYPGENVFMKFIEDHAGSSNAYTSTENTNYHFEVATTHFKEALDIFAQFFIAPLFDESSTDRELNAVDSENQKNLQSDAWRLDQLEKSTCSPDHPFSKFGTGNMSTLKHEPEKLGLSVREELLRFHSKYYSSNLMSVCLLGKESLDELQAYVGEIFSEITNKNLPYIDFPPEPFGQDTLATKKFVVPVQDLRNMSISWVIPDYREKYEANPANYISHLVGHEGDGSLLSELKRRGWCNHLYAGARREARGFQFFNITLDLSDEGSEHVDEIIKLVYQYLNMLKSERPLRWIYDELNDLGKISFNFKDKEKPIHLVSSLSADMHVYAMERVLSAGYYLTKFEPELIESLYKYLVPDKMRVTLISKKFQGHTDKVEKWYGTEYRMEKMNQHQLQELNSCGKNSAFSLPPKNTFIPSNLELIKHDEWLHDLPKIPRIIYNTSLARLWYKEDAKFLLPKAVLKFEIRNPIVYFNPTHVNMSNLFVELLKDSLTEYSYAAELAGLKYNINPSNYGMNVSLSGFSDKMNVLLETVFERIASFRVDPQRFNVLKESYQRSLANFEAEQPYKHAVYYTTLLISEKGWTKQQLLDAINDFTIDDLQNFIPKLLTSGIFIESVMFGNIHKNRAIEFLNIVENKLKSTSLVKCERLRSLDKAQLNNFRQIQLPEGCNYVYLKNNNIHKTVGIEVYYQCGQQSTYDNALVELFCQVINEAGFNILRTQEQLGYIVASGVRNFGGAQGVRLIIQSDRPPNFLDERIENFIKITKDSIENMTDEEFQMHVDALILTKLEEPKKMSKQCDIYWNEIASHQYQFEREQIEVNELRKITKAELYDFYKKFISAESKHRRKLAVYIHPPEMNSELSRNVKGELIQNFSLWQSTLPLYPLLKPAISLD